MDTNRSAALALIGGSLAGLVTMILHPTGHDVITNASTGAANTLNSAVHLLSIVAQPLILAGALAVTARLRAGRDLAVTAYVFFALGGVCIIVAAVASGFIAPALLGGMATASEAQRAGMLADLRFAGIVNQAFAKVYVTFAGLAIMLWSLAIMKGREMSRVLAVYGLVAGPILVAGVTADILTLDIHGFGAVVLAVGLWMIWAGRSLLVESAD